MKIQNIMLTKLANLNEVKLHFFKRRLSFLCLTLIFSFLFFGCKKNSVDPANRDYGYGKVTVNCEGQCHFESGEQGNMNAFDVDGSTAVMYFRYKANYALNVNITPIGSTQTITLQVYTRAEKLVFNTTTRKKVGEVWNNAILVP